MRVSKDIVSQQEVSFGGMSMDYDKKTLASREEDVRIEQVCGKFLDENFYSKLGCKFERNSVLSSQYLGVDVTIWS